MAEILRTKISREQLSERISFHFKEIFKRDWEKKDMGQVDADGIDREYRR